MQEIENKINELEKRLDDLIKTQVTFQQTTSQIRYEISVLRAVQQKQARPEQDNVYRQAEPQGSARVSAEPKSPLSGVEQPNIPQLQQNHPPAHPLPSSYGPKTESSSGSRP